MFALILHAEGMPQPMRLWYKDQEKADAVLNGIVEIRWPLPGAAKNESLIQLSDDFGTHARFDKALLRAVQLIDVDGEAKASGEVSIVQGRAQMATQARANADPVMNLQRAPAGLIRAS